MKTVHGKNGKSGGVRRGKPRRPRPTGNLKSDGDRARGVTLGSLVNSIDRHAPAAVAHMARVGDAIDLEDNEWSWVIAVRRWLVRNRSLLCRAFREAPAGEQFLLRELLLQSANHFLNIERNIHAFPPEELEETALRASADLRELVPLLRAGVEPEKPSVRTCLRQVERQAKQATTLLALLLAYVTDVCTIGKPEDSEERLDGLAYLVAGSQRRLKAVLENAMSVAADDGTVPPAGVANGGKS